MKVLDKNGAEIGDGAAVDSWRGPGTIAGVQLVQGRELHALVRLHRLDAHPVSFFCVETDDPAVLQCNDLELIEEE